MDFTLADRPAPIRRKPALPPKPEPKDTSVLTREFIFNTVATVFEVDSMLLGQPTRGQARTALARQVAMYLAHVGCELTLTAVGRIFGRDRSTVAHACRRVEDARERPKFDRAVTMMEQTVRAIVQTSPALRRDLLLAEEGLIEPGLCDESFLDRAHSKAADYSTGGCENNVATSPSWSDASPFRKEQSR